MTTHDPFEIRKVIPLSLHRRPQEFRFTTLPKPAAPVFPPRSLEAPRGLAGGVELPSEPSELLKTARGIRDCGAEMEQLAIRRALERCHWCVQPAAKLLGIPHSSLVQLLAGRHKALAAEVEQKRVRPKPGEKR